MPSSSSSSSSDSSSRKGGGGGGSNKKKSWIHVGVVTALVLAFLIQTAPGTTGPPPPAASVPSSASSYRQRLLDPGTIIVSENDNEKRSSVLSTDDDDDDKMYQTTIRFVGGDGRTTLTGRLYIPHLSPSDHSKGGFPVIVMAHGLGLVQDSRPIDEFRRTFVERGNDYAVFTFDYATFGHSDGFPRHMVRPHQHIQDIEAAITMLTTSTSPSSATIELLRTKIDKSRVGLWGTSLAGGHQVVVAANAEQKLGQKRQQTTSTADTKGTEEPPRIKAVVSLVPHLASGVESILEALIDPPRCRHTLQGILNFLHYLIKWTVWQLMPLSSEPWYIPLTGQPGSCSMMQNAGDLEGYTRLQQPQTEEYWWQNAADGWSAFHVLFYRPLNRIHELTQTPTLFIAAQNDTLCPSSHVERVVSISPRSNMESIIINDKGHFDLYNGRPLEEIINATLDFFNRHL